MNGVRTYRSEDQESNNEKSKRVECPNCKRIGFTIVKKESNPWAYIGIIVVPFLIICACLKDFGKKEVHYCRFCNHDYTDVKPYEESNCIIF